MVLQEHTKVVGIIEHIRMFLF